MAEAMKFKAFSGPEGRPTDAERRLIRACAQGAIAECDDLADDQRVVSADLVLALATGTFRHPDWSAWSLAATGLRVSGIRLLETLDLESRLIPADLLFSRCSFEEGIDLDNARLDGRLCLSHSTVGGVLRLVSAVISHQVEATGATFESSIEAHAASTGTWLLDGAKVLGGLNLSDARIAGDFVANDTSFECPDGPAVFAPGVASRVWLLNGTVVKGGIDLDGARLEGALIATAARFDAPGGDAFRAGRIDATSITMDRATFTGRCYLLGAHVAHHFSASGATFDNPDDVAVCAQEVQSSGWWIDEANVRGTFDLNSTTIGGQFNANGTTFDNAGSVAISAFSVRARDWLMSDTVVHGAVDVSGGEFMGGFGGDRAKILFPCGTAFDGRGASFHGGVYLRAGTEVTGDADLTGATIGQILDLSGAVWKAARYRAVRLQEATIQGEVVLRDAVLYGHLHANRARIEGRVDLRRSTIVAATVARSRGDLPEELGESAGPADEERQERFRHHAIVLQEARIDGRLAMPDRCPEGIVDLSRARCDTLEDSASGWPVPLKPRSDFCEARICAPAADGELADIQHLVLDGFDYQHFEYPTGKPNGTGDVATARSNWLAGQSAKELRAQFNPQPWRQAATVLRSMGYDEAAQDLSIQRRVRQRFSADTPRRERIVSWLLHRIADYGFNPWKTVGISVACVLLFAFVYSGLTRLCNGYGIWSAIEGSCGNIPIMVAVQYGSVDPALADRAYPTFDLAWLGNQPDAREGIMSFLEKRAPAWQMSVRDIPEGLL